jgi:hypothetical protein
VTEGALKRQTERRDGLVRKADSNPYGLITGTAV